jgi:septal ring factor EnvC (AmiA/AmiB activator)
MIAPTPPTTLVSSIEHSTIEKARHGIIVRDFAPTCEQAPQLQSSGVQSEKSKIETLEQRIGNMSDFLLDQDDEKRGLKAMLGEQRREIGRQKSELENMAEENTQLKARIQQLEQQK